jgi:hypothetical protein
MRPPQAERRQARVGIDQMGRWDCDAIGSPQIFAEDLDVGIGQMSTVGLRHLGVLNRLLHGAERGN